MAFFTDSTEPLNCSIAPFRLFIFSAATCAAVVFDISVYIFLTPSAPSLYIRLPARIASVPNIVSR